MPSYSRSAISAANSKKHYLSTLIPVAHHDRYHPKIHPRPISTIDASTLFCLKRQNAVLAKKKPMHHPNTIRLGSSQLKVGKRGIVLRLHFLSTHVSMSYTLCESSISTVYKSHLRIRIPMHRLSIILIKIPRIIRTPQMRHNRPLHLAMIHRIPVDIPKPGVRLHGRRAALDIP